MGKGGRAPAPKPAPAPPEPAPAELPPEAVPPGPYDEQVGLMMLGFHRSVCCGNATGFRPPGTGQHRFISEALTAANAGVGVMTDVDGCFVAQRGTHSTVSGVLDADFLPVPFRNSTCPGCQVFHGFLVVYEAVMGEIFSALSEFGCEQKPLYLVGHSLGAAGVHYLLYDALERGYAVEHAYAIESPRPGNKAFGEALRSKAQGVSAWRISHYRDIVVQIPPVGLMGYSHALHEIYYHEHSGTRYRQCGIEDLACSQVWQFQPWFWRTGDHCWYAGHNPCMCSSAAVAEDLASSSQPSPPEEAAAPVIAEGGHLPPAGLTFRSPQGFRRLRGELW